MKGPLLALALAGSCLAQGTGESTPADSRQVVIERLFSERESEQALAQAIEAARSSGVSDQAILEARFLYHVDRREDAKLASLLPEFLERKDRFKLSDSEIFAVEEDWLAVVEYVQAIASLQKDDRQGFKRHITEAFWLSPRQGTAFAPHIERLRLDEAMNKIRLDLSREFTRITGGKESLAGLLGDSKAVLLHFFSPWSRESAESIPDLVATAAELGKHEIPVVTILGEPDADSLEETRTLLKDHDPVPGERWLIDSTKDSLSLRLRVQNVPIMVLISRDGRVLYHGHPAEDGLWTELRRIAPDLKRPPVSTPGH